jgi:hypothetical protein
MAPKKEPQKPKDKVVVDKTFGMKNKKGSVAQKQIKQIEAAKASSKTPDEKRKEAEKAQRERDKKAAEEAKREAAELFKPIQVQKVPFGVDPKTVVCQFFKKGACDKGKKCKFSHDLAVERKTEKKDLYQDMRDKDEGDNADGMDDWDEEKLRQVVLSKHGNPRTTTDKVCKYFIQAIEDQKYGWRWVCPNGGDACMYRHNLPPGFILKTKEQRAAEKALMDKSPLATLTLEDWLESERHKLTGTLTPVTPETFAEWKKKRLDKKAAEEEAQKMKEATGRAMFEKGDWQFSDSEEEDEDDERDGVWNLEAMRRETEALRQKREEERLTALMGSPSQNGAVEGTGPGPGEDDEAES